jgi:hypothetical protein
MMLDYGAADGQADPHPAALGRIERFEQSIGAFPIEADSGIFHGQAYMVVCVSFRFDYQLPSAIVDIAHRSRCVQEQVENDLLKLDAISGDRRKVVGELLLQNHLVSPEFSR